MRARAQWCQDRAAAVTGRQSGGPSRQSDTCLHVLAIPRAAGPRASTQSLMISMISKSSYCWVFPRILTLELRLLSLKFTPVDKANAEVGFSICCLNSKSHQVPHLGDCKKHLDTFQFLASHFFLPARVCAQLLQPYPILVTPWTVARQPALSMGVSRQESWSGLPSPPPGDRLHPGTESTSPVSPALQADAGETLFLSILNLKLFSSKTNTWAPGRYRG